MPPIPCRACPLRNQPLFAPLSEEEVAFMQHFKRGELEIGPGMTILQDGQSSSHLYTVLSGQGVRYKTLPDGRRQVINFLAPGDFLGLQASFLGEMKHSAEARTRMLLCVFDRSRFWELFRAQPARAYDLVWLASVDEHFLGETIATLGQRDATQRIAWALLKTWQRLRATGLGRDGTVPFPFRQQDLADALGLSLVHTNKTLGRFRLRQLCDWSGGELRILDAPALAELGLVELEPLPQRPLM